MRIKKTIFFLILVLFAVLLIPKDRVEAFQCNLLYNYGFPGSACNNSVTLPKIAMWKRICDSIPACDATKIPPGGGQYAWWFYSCKGAWYEGVCDTGDSGTFSCPCGNVYTCTTPAPTATNTPTPTFSPTPTPAPTPVVGCQQSGNTWCSNHGGIALTVPYDVSNWAQCLAWCNSNMSVANPLCQYNADAPRNCWVNKPPVGGIATCTWTAGTPPFGACFTPYVNPNNAPSCSSLNISNNSPTQGNIITLSALATDDVAVQTVKFYWGIPDGFTCGGKTRYNWTFIANGTYNAGNGRYETSFNTTGVPIGDVIISTNVYDNGGPQLSCTANPTCNGNMGCCTETASCPNCSQSISILPPCTMPTMTLSASCNILTATYNADGTHNAVSDTVTIREDMSSTAFTLSPATAFGNNIGLRTATYPYGSTTSGRDPNKPLTTHPVYWTHTWQNVVNGKTSVLCSNTTPMYSADQYNIPRCEAPSVVYQEGLKNPVWTTDGNFNVDIKDKPQEGGTGGFLYKYQSDPSIPNDSYIQCSRDLTPAGVFPPVTFGDPYEPGNVGLYHCSVLSVGTSSAWTHQYSRYVWGCPNLVTNNCSVTFSPGVQVKRPPGLLLTTGGDVYIRGLIDQQGFPSAPGSVSFSTQTLSSALPVANHKLSSMGICASSPKVCSTNQYLLLGYNDANTNVSPTWFATLQKIIDQDKIRTRRNFPTAPSSTYSAVDAETYQILNYNNDLVVPADSKCTNKNIIIVNGNLTINPQFTLDTRSTDACLFIVKGTVFVGAGSDALQDKIEAFIIAGNIEVPWNNQDGLKIFGGLITTGASANLFQRNINGNTPAQYYPDKPSEVLVYEGARYINSFGDLLKNPSLLGIREPTYQ